MNLIILVAIVFFAKGFCFNVEFIEGIKGDIKSVNFDSGYNNCYFVSYLDGTYYFHKMDNEKNISLTQTFHNIDKVIINRKNDVYLFERIEDEKCKKKEEIIQDGDFEMGPFGFNIQIHKSQSRFYRGEPPQPPSTRPPTPIFCTKNLIWIMKENARELTKLYFWKGGENPKSFLDKDDFLFVSANYGLILFDPDQNAPLALFDKKVEAFESFASDEKGNVFVNTRSSVFVISNHEKRKSAPQVTELNLKYNNIIVNSIATDCDGGLYYATKSEGDSTEANLNSFVDSSQGFGYSSHPSFMYSQFDSTFNFIYRTKERLYLTSDISRDYFNIIFIHEVPGYTKIAAIEELFEYPLITNENENLLASDSLGSVFFVHDKTVLSIKHNETRVTRITPPSMKKISSILVDIYDNLWVLAENLYLYKKGTSNAILVPNALGTEDSLMKENRVTGEIYVGSSTGLIVIQT